jgi:hypothetical protein
LDDVQPENRESREQIMNGTETRPSKWRSVWAVVAGLIVIVVLSMGMDAIMHVTGVFPPYGQAMSDGLFAWATIYRVISSIIGCYIAARLAPNRPITHALYLGVLGVLISAVATVATWNKGPGIRSALVSDRAGAGVDPVCVDWRESL